MLNKKNNFNFLRFVFASLVIISHTYSILDGNEYREPLKRLFGTLTLGEIAVDGFFLLSGYLIANSWQTAPTAGVFLKKRVARIYPAFIMAYILSLLVAGFVGWRCDWNYFSQIKPIYALFRLIFLMTPVVPVAFPGSYYDALNGSMWTIFFEFVCYISICILGVTKALNRTNFVLLLTCILLVINGLIQRFGETENWTYAALSMAHAIRLLGIFLAGTSFFLLRDRVDFNDHAAFAALLVLCMAMWIKGLAEIGVATAGGYLLFWIAFNVTSLVHFSTRLHDYSYGIYLYSWPLQKIIISVFFFTSPLLIITTTFITATIAGAGSWYLIEKKFLQPSPR